MSQDIKFDLLEEKKGRNRYFILIAFVLILLLSTGVVASLFGRDIAIGNDLNKTDMVMSVMDVETPEIKPERENRPLQRNESQRPNTQQPVATAPPQPTESTKIDENVPVSTTPPPVRIPSFFPPQESGPPTDSGIRRSPGSGGTGGLGESSGNGSNSKTPMVDESEPPPPAPKPPAPKPVEPPAKPVTVSLGAVAGKATSLPKPLYPPTAKSVRAAGAVEVLILIDEDGNVLSAQAKSGNPLLRQAAADAARKAKFFPTTLSGQRVRVSGTITYNFVLP